MTDSDRIDEVAREYVPVKALEGCERLLFWLIVIVSLVIPFGLELWSPNVQNVVQIIFVLLVILSFVASTSLWIYFRPKAECARRRQMISNSIGAALTDHKTKGYYNNDYQPSMLRLGANTMENALFSKEIANRMLWKDRIAILVYFLAWVAIFAVRHSSVDVLIWVTQVLFSAELLADWLKLEWLRMRCEETYQYLHRHFLNKLGDSSPEAIAGILDAFTNYETAKTAAGITLSSKVFTQMNSELSERWQRIERDLKMNS